MYLQKETGLFDVHGRPLRLPSQLLPQEKGIIAAQRQLNTLSPYHPHRAWLSSSITAGINLVEQIKKSG